MKRLLQFIICLLIITGAQAQNPNSLITAQMLTGTVYPCYYKTYDDFLNGNPIPAHSVSHMGNLVFVIDGKSVSIKPDDIWGYRDNQNRLIRVNHTDGQVYAVYGVGDVIYYDDNTRYTPGEAGWGAGPDLIGDFGMSVHYKKDGSVEHAYYAGANDKWLRPAVSANLNSPMINLKQFADDKTFNDLAANNPYLLAFATMWPRDKDRISQYNLKHALFVTAFNFKSHPLHVAYSRNKGKEIYFK